MLDGAFFVGILYLPFIPCHGDPFDGAFRGHCSCCSAHAAAASASQRPHGGQRLCYGCHDAKEDQRWGDLQMDVGQNGRPLRGPQMGMSSLVLTIQLLRYLILTHTQIHHDSPKEIPWFMGFSAIFFERPVCFKDHS